MRQVVVGKTECYFLFASLLVKLASTFLHLHHCPIPLRSISQGEGPFRDAHRPRPSRCGARGEGFVFFFFVCRFLGLCHVCCLFCCFCFFVLVLGGGGWFCRCDYLLEGLFLCDFFPIWCLDYFLIFDGIDSDPVGAGCSCAIFLCLGCFCAIFLSIWFSQFSELCWNWVWPCKGRLFLCDFSLDGLFLCDFLLD